MGKLLLLALNKQEEKAIDKTYTRMTRLLIGMRGVQVPWSCQAVRFAHSRKSTTAIRRYILKGRLPMINSKQLDFMSRQGTDTADPAQLTDINHVSIDTGLSAKERMKAYLEQIKNPHCFRCGETVVRLSFAPAENDLNSYLINFFGGLKKG